MDFSRGTQVRMREMERAMDAINVLAPNASLAREAGRLWRAEIVGSSIIAGSSLTPGEIDALIDRGIAQGDHPLEHYLLVRAYAGAARWVADQRVIAPGDSRPLLSVEELRQLHVRAAAGSPLHAGAWRLGNPAPRSQIVPPAAWLVPREVDAAIDRLGHGPLGQPIALWIARFIARIGRIRPFEGANGRTSRLAANLMLRRLNLQAVAFERTERARYGDALAAAESGEPTLLADLIARAVNRSCNRLRAAARAASDPLAPLRELAGDAYATLAKAAQRGTLQTVTRGGRYFTTRDWIENYRATHPRVRSVRPKS
jgi:Fic family protein